MNLVQPIRDPDKVEAIKNYFREHENKRNYILFVTGINTGLRISDILKLKVGDVKESHIIIREQKTKKQKWIRITPALRRELNSFIIDKDENEYIFKSRQGGNKPISRGMAYKILKDAASKFKLKDIGCHTLRKTFGYHFYKQTKNVAMLQEIFNHSEQYITLKYIGMNQDEMDKAMMNFKI